MATHRGMDGSATIGGTTIVQIIEWELDPGIDVLRTAVMGNKWETVKGGMGRWTGRIRCKFDYVTGNGQKTLVDYLAAATPASTSAALVLIANTTGPKQFSGNALLSGFRLSNPVQGELEVEFNFEGDGALSISWT